MGCWYVGLRLVWLRVGLRFECICVGTWVCGRVIVFDGVVFTFVAW